MTTTAENTPSIGESRASGIPIFKYRDIIPQLFGLVVLGRLRFRFELVPYEVRRLSLAKRINFFRAGFNQILPRPRPFGRPVIAQVEPANFCNLTCPLCLTASETSSRPKALLPFETFKEFIDDAGDRLLLLILWNWGEPFLNPDIFRMIAYAKSKGILVHCSTNGNVPFDPGRAERLIEAGPDTLIFGVDGASQATYSIYRRGGDLDKVRENITSLVRAKRERGAETPRVVLRFVVMKHNEHEIPRIREMARALEVDFLAFKTVDLPSARGEGNDPRYAPAAPRYRRYAYEKGTFRRVRRPFVCYRPWKRITLEASGRIIPCEYDYTNAHACGVVGRDGAAVDLWKGAAARAFRKGFHRGRNDYGMCRTCTYKDLVGDECNVEIVDLRGGDAGHG
jgi:radical SAM protein with 4Fe4S-binding SPASM domain